ncbi:MAG: hypothetical protein V4456_03750 [Bacteroidota bacterium]
MIPGFSPNYLGYSFNKDSTFCLNSWSDILGKDEVCGKWKMSKDTILLFKNPDKVKIKSDAVATFNESNSEPSKIKIIVQDTHNEPIPGVNLVLNNNSRKYVTDKDGIFETNYQKINKLEIEYIGIGKHSFIPQANSNLFFIKFDFDAIRLEKLKLPEKLLWRGNAIYDLSSNKVISGYSFHKTNGKVKGRN